MSVDAKMWKFVLGVINIDYLMNMTKKSLTGKIDRICYSLDFPYELEQRYLKMYQEDDDCCKLICEYLFDEGVVRHIKKLSDIEFKKLVRNQNNYIKELQKEDFINKQLHWLEVEFYYKLWYVINKEI